LQSDARFSDRLSRIFAEPRQRNAKTDVAVVPLSLSGFVEEGAFAMQQHVVKANIDHIKKLLEFETDPSPEHATLFPG
jgi:hypothetical protein